MSKLLHSATQNLANLASVNRLAKFTAFLLIFGFTSGRAIAQDSFISDDGPTTICAGESTALQVIIGASVGPYTITYSDGAGNFTVNNYNSVGDPESPLYGGDPIPVSPTVTTTYSLVSVLDNFNTSLPVSSATVAITVNPLPSNIVVSTNPAAPVCPGVNFTVSATATNGSFFELWNQANTEKIGDIPYVTSITSPTTFTVRAISAHSCTATQALTVNIESTPPTISCPGNQTLNPNPASGCTAPLPDYRSLVTATDNCTAAGSLILSQSPAAGTILSGHSANQTVTITATDAAGNQNSCNFTVTLIDNIDPQISCVGNQTVPAGAGCTYVHTGTAWNAAGTDNCTIASVTYSANNGASPATGTNLDGVVFQPGTTSVTWTVTDGAGLTEQCSFTVSIADTQIPTASCVGDQSVNTNSGCTYIHSGTSWNVTASDNCTVASTVYTLSGATSGTLNTTLNGVAFNKGTTTVSVLVSDGAAVPNTNTCSFTVTVADDDLPTITCPSNISANTDAGQCSAAVVVPTITFSDNCPGSTISWSTTGVTEMTGSGQPGTQTFNKGLTTVLVTVTDEANLTAQCSFTVEITDNEQPSLTCPGNITSNNTPGSCTANVTLPVIAFGDNCSGSSLSWTTSGATTLNGNGQSGTQTFNTGITTVTLKVTDAAGLTRLCSFDVTVTDNENPTIVCPDNLTANNDLNLCSASVDVPAIVFGDNCSGTILTWAMTGATVRTGNGQLGTQVFNVGATAVTLTATDASVPAHTATCSFTVTVNDTQKPVIAGCPANITRTSSPGVCTSVVSWTEPTATDNCTLAGSLIWTKSHTPGSVFQSGVTTVTYTARDAAGNESDVCSFTVTVIDNQKPVISGCPSNISVSTDAGACSAVVSWTEPTATDNCTALGNLVWTKSHTPGSTFTVGTTTVTYTVRDASNNASNPCAFNITVTDNVAPVAICKPATIYLNASGNATLTVADVNNGSSDNCTPAGNLIITLSKTAFNCANIGPNNVVMTVRDASGNQSTCTAIVTVADNLPPSITATPGTVTSNVNAGSGVCYYTVNGIEFDPTVTDNCSSVVRSYTVSGATTLSGNGSLAGKQLNKGANVITWTATDGSGNVVASPLTFTKTVIDNQPPVISSIGNQNRNTNLGNCGYTVSGTEFDATYSDNCGAGSLTITYRINTDTPIVANTLAGVIIPKGVNQIVWTASDGTNSSTSSFRVTVLDDDAPEITVIDNIVVEISTGCGAVAIWTEPTASDNCGVTIVGQVAGQESGSTFPIGTTQIRYRAADAAGNTTFMGFTVEVRDLTPPVLTCPEGSPFTREAATGVCFYSVAGTEFNVTTDDGCPVTATNSFDGTNTLAGKQLPAGSNTIVWTATDGSGNSSTCTIIVNVEDNQFPTFDQPTGTFAKNTDPGKCFYTVPGTNYDLRNIYDNCATQTPTYVITKNGVTEFTGTNSLAGLQLPKDANHAYVVVWTLSDVHGNVVVANAFNITVADNQPPQFFCFGNEIRTAPGSSCDYTIQRTEFDASGVTDNCDATFSLGYTLDGVPGGTSTSLAGIVLTAGVHTIVWTATDQSGNSNVCTFKVTVKDTIFPTISTISNQTRNAPANECYYTAIGTEFDPTFSDNCLSTTITNSLNNSATLAGYDFPVGITVVVWTATDPSGNSTVMQFEVEVKDVTAPDFDLPATIAKITNANKLLLYCSGR